MTTLDLVAHHGIDPLLLLALLWLVLAFVGAVLR